MNEEELKIVITAQADKLKNALANATNQVNNFERKTNTSVSAMTKGFSKLGAVISKVFAIGVILKFGKACIDTATQTQNAWIGLNSILTGKTGTTEAFKNAQSFIQDYVKDGLVPLNNAVASYKNLALRGYNSNQIEKTMNALKNSATFARQSTYSLGEAVQTATEGLKNENSVVVDNAGVTKNVAKMWEDYAKSIGKTTNALTQQEKIEAEVNGILEETKFQSNDAKIYSETYSGSIARLTTAFTNMKTAIGEVIQPIVKLLTPAIETLFNWISSLFKGITALFSLFGFTSDLDKVTSQISGVGSATEEMNENLEDTATSSKKATKGLAKFDEINNLQQDTKGGSGVGGGGANLQAENVELKKTESTLDEVSNKLNGLFGDINLQPTIDAFKKLGEQIKRIADLLGQGIKWIWENIFKDLATYEINETLPKSIETLANALELLAVSCKVLAPFLKPVLELIGKWLQFNLETGTKEVELLGKAFKELSNQVKIGYLIYFETMPKVWEDLKKKPAETLSNLFGTYLEYTAKILGFTNNDFKQGFINAWVGVKDGIANIWEGIKAVTKNAVNDMISKVNKMISGLETAINVVVDAINRIEIKNPFTGEDIWSPHLPKMSFSRVPMLAKGGIVDGATTFIAGEHGKEAVIPLENNTEWLDKMASRVVTMFNAVNGLNGNSLTINVPVELNGREIAKGTIQDLNQEAIRQGFKPILI